MPVIVFDRGADSDDMVTFIHPIGGYAYGADGADFIVDDVEPGAMVLALRILPGSQRAGAPCRERHRGLGQRR